MLCDVCFTEIGHCITNFGTSYATQCAVLRQGHVLPQETLMALVANGMDKKNLILHAVTDA